MDITTLRVAATLLSFFAFIGVLVWAYLPGHAARFEADGQLPFEDGEPR